MDFIKNALREIKHVVWPTREETKKYFVVVLSVLCAFGLYLFIVWNIFSQILFGLKEMVNPSAPVSIDDIQLPEGLEDLSEQVEPIEANPIIPDVTGESIESEVWEEAIVEDVVEVESTEVQ